MCVWVQAHIWVRRCAPTRDLLPRIHFWEAIRGWWCKAPVGMRLIISSDWWWSVCPLFKAVWRHDRTQNPPPLLLPKCKFIIIMISAAICAISTHLSASPHAFTSPYASIEPHPALEKNPIECWGERRAFLLSEYHVSLAPSCSIIWFPYKPLPRFQWNRGTGREEQGESA